MLPNCSVMLRDMYEYDVLYVWVYAHIYLMDVPKRVRLVYICIFFVPAQRSKTIYK